MPEYTELVSSCRLAITWFNSVKSDPENTCEFILGGIMVDATMKEQDLALTTIKEAKAIAKATEEAAKKAVNSEEKRAAASAAAAAAVVATIAADVVMTKIAAGHPYYIEPGCTVARGQNGAQGLVYPHPLGTTPIPYAKIQLADVEFNPRNIILEMTSPETETGYLILQVQMLTHTVLQIYTGDQWHNSICKVSADTRGFRVGLALDFGKWVLAFLSLDNMFKPIYAIDRDDLPAQHIDVYFNFEAFVNAAVHWAHCSLFTQTLANTSNKPPTTFPMAPAPRDRLALHAVRNSDVFGGIGVYTGPEIFFLAGLAVDLTEGEVFDNPSRFARLIEGFHEIAAAAHEEIWDFVKPFLHNQYFIAVENKHRLLYADRLYVHAKNRTQMPKRMRSLFDTYVAEINLRAEGASWIRRPDGKMFDVFEPSFLERSLSKPKNLGSLIFGKDQWRKLGGIVWEDNPMEHYFARRYANPMDKFVIMKKPSVAPPDFIPSSDFYQPLYLSSKDRKGSWVQTHLYSTTDKKAWSILPLLPSNSLPNRPSKAKFVTPDIEEITGEKRDTEIFSYIVKYTKKWAVGPLDYCGVAHIIHDSIALCQDDPEASPYIVHRLARSSERRTHTKKGTRKTAYTNKQREGIKYKRTSSPAVNSDVTDAMAANKSDEDVAGPSDTALKRKEPTGQLTNSKPGKTPRLSADAKIALGHSLTVWRKEKVKIPKE